MRTLLLVLLLLGVAGAGPVSATGHWKPADIHPTPATLTDVLAKAHPAPFDSRDDVYAIVRQGVRVTSTLRRRGADYLAQTLLGSATYTTGRSSGVLWSRGTNGLVRLTGADISNGDDLDRWPAAIFPLDPGACVLAGEAGVPNPAWVIQYGAPGDAPRWIYIDEASGAIVREIIRDGIKMVTTAFDPAENSGRPTHWQVAGGEHDLDVRLVSQGPGDPSMGTSIPIPISVSPHVALAPGATVVPARFAGREILVPVRIGERVDQFALDTGTSDVEIDRLTAAGRGMPAVFDHAVIGEMTIGSVHFHDMPIIQSTGLSAGPERGLLGFDFFAGHIVHIDYAHERLELYARPGFKAPANAARLSADYREGVPLVTARIGRAMGRRFLLDIGSPRVVIARYFAERDGQATETYDVDGPPGPLRGENYLEGLVVTRTIKLRALALGPYTISIDSADLEERHDETIDTAIETPFDGIIGTDVMARFEWWFDYDGGAVWLRPALALPR
jgi:hypothetical protein